MARDQLSILLLVTAVLMILGAGVLADDLSHRSTMAAPHRCSVLLQAF